ncbi:MAG: hypothetical protein ACYC61_21635 [Isosphaeraceae bacterium]
MNPRWPDIRCASIPVEGLKALADLRREPGLRVMVVGPRAWIRWEDDSRAANGDDSSRPMPPLLRRLLALPGAEVFIPGTGGRWHRSGESLPAFHVPAAIGEAIPGGSPLDSVVLPDRIHPEAPDRTPPAAVPLRLVRDDSGCPRPAMAQRCRLKALAGWADSVPSAWIEALTAAWTPSPSGDPGEAEVLLLGPAARLPFVPGGTRFWGATVLIPLGYCASPALGEPSLREAVAAGPDDLVVLDERGPELIPRGVFGRLSRASLRLALAQASSHPAPGEVRP